MSVSNYIDKVAAEVEGIWIALPGLRGKDLQKDGVPVIHDGSVKMPKNFRDGIVQALEKESKKAGHRLSMDSFLMKGEIVSAPMEKEEPLAQWLTNYWPDVTNNSCGLHFHISVLKNGYYSCLMQPEFNAYYKASLEKLIKDEKFNKIIQDRFFNRTRWAKEYCEDDFRPEKQCYVDRKIYRNQSTARYSQLNFCWSLHSTVEVRTFTAHCSSRVAVKCLSWWVNLVNSYLETHYDNFIKNGGLEYDVSLDLEDAEQKSKKVVISQDEDVSDIQDLINNNNILSFPDLDEDNGIEVATEEEYEEEIISKILNEVGKF